MEKEKFPIIYLSYFGTAPPSYYGIRYQYMPGYARRLAFGMAAAC
jgi:hypothetical protein